MRAKYKSKKKSKVIDRTNIYHLEAPLDMEPAREYYCQKDAKERITKLSSSASQSDAFENSMASSMSSIAPFQFADLTNNESEKIEFMKKYNESKDKEKKYKKEIKILKMEKKKLIIKNRKLTVERKVGLITEKNCLINLLFRVRQKRMKKRTKMKKFESKKVGEIFIYCVENVKKQKGSELDHSPIRLGKSSSDKSNLKLKKRIKKLKAENERLMSELSKTSTKSSIDNETADLLAEKTKEAAELLTKSKLKYL